MKEIITLQQYFEQVTTDMSGTEGKINVRQAQSKVFNIVIGIWGNANAKTKACLIKISNKRPIRRMYMLDT